MGDAGERIEFRYQGERGIEYYNDVFRHDSATYETIARWRKRKFQPFVTEDDDVLEFGAGLLHNLALLKAKTKSGYDLSDAARHEASEREITFYSHLSQLEGRQFSVLICHHMLEHAPDPVNKLEIMRDLLKPRGKLILCVPFETARCYRSWFPNEPNHHLYSWNPLTLGNLVHDVGFDIEESKINPYGYEQRLAPLLKFGDGLYALGLKVVRMMRPANEVMLVATKR